jgi:ribosomal protein S18 acetylase RimI-like enzyme
VIEENTIAYYQGLAHALGGEFFVQEHIVWFITGRRSLTRFNGVLRTMVAPEKLEAIATPVLKTFLDDRLPFFWVDFPTGTSPGLGGYLEARGVSLIARAMPAMHRSLAGLPELCLPDEVEISIVSTAQDQIDWLDVLMQGFYEPREARADFRQFLSHTLNESPTRWENFLARWQGEPCAVLTLLYARQAAGVYHVATLPAFRRRGLGKALTLAAMQTARERGYASAVLFATPDGYPLYRQLGFETAVSADLYARDG